VEDQDSLTTEERGIITKLKESLRENIQTALSWIDKPEGRILAKSIASLGSFVLGDPTGMLLPTIFELGDVATRKRFLKHLPDALNRLNQQKSKLNEDFYKSQIGQKILKDTIREFAKETDEVKIEVLKSFLITAFKQKKPEEFIQICHQRLLEMRSIHLQILDIVSNPQPRLQNMIKEKKEKQNQQLFEEPNTFDFWKTDLNQFLIKEDDDIFNNAVKDLQNWNMLVGTLPPTRYSFVGNSPENLAKTLEHKMEESLTNFGRRFIRFVKGTPLE